MRQQAAQAGVLYVVATPIGNLEDITMRALRVLRECDLIACEDTRQTQKLLNHFGIEKPTVSYHEHNEDRRSEELMERLRAGGNVALVSDAGTPGISDPGYRVVTRAIAAGVRVEPVPGASAIAVALVGSGLPTDAFAYRGFLPAKAGQRRTVLESVTTAEETQVFYEAPHRLLETLREIREVLGPERPVVVARELTKLHEEFVRGSADEVLRALESRDGEVKGEITLLIGRGAPGAPAPIAKISARDRLEQLMREQQLDEKAALKALARERGVSKSEVYREVQRKR